MDKGVAFTCLSSEVQVGWVDTKEDSLTRCCQYSDSYKHQGLCCCLRVAVQSVGPEPAGLGSPQSLLVRDAGKGETSAALGADWPRVTGLPAVWSGTEALPHKARFDALLALRFLPLPAPRLRGQLRTGRHCLLH